MNRAIHIYLSPPWKMYDGEGGMGEGEKETVCALLSATPSLRHSPP